MTPHDQGLDRLVEDPSLLGLEQVSIVKREIPLYDPKFSTITDIDALFELSNGGIAIAELKSGSSTRWLKAMRQLTIGSHYVQQRYGVTPACFYVHGGPERFYVLRSDEGVGRFERVAKGQHPGIERRINSQLPMFADRLPQSVLFYGGD